MRSTLTFLVLITFMFCIGTTMPLSAQSQWVITDPGAGGAFLQVAAGPSGIVLAGVDLAGGYRSTNFGATWTNNGYLQGGLPTGLGAAHTSTVGFDPTWAGTTYLGTETGLYRSQDSGATYMLVSPPATPGYFTSVVISVSQPLIGYAAYHPTFSSINGQVYKTTNGGGTWSPIGPVQTGKRIQKLVIDPTNPNIVYYVAQNDFLTKRSASQLFKSSDGGTSWTRLGGTALSSGVLDFAVDATTRTTLYCTVKRTGTVGLYKSTDGGNSWTKRAPYYGIVISKPDQPQTIRVFNLNGGFDGTNRILNESLDGGATWTQKSDRTNLHQGWASYAVMPTFYQGYGTTYAYCKTIGVDLSNPNTYYWGDTQFVYKSTDGGVNFNQTFTNETPVGSNKWKGNGMSNAVPFDMTISEANHNIVYAGYADLGLFRSTDEGATWQNANDCPFAQSWCTIGGSTAGIALGGNTQTVVADPVRAGVVWAPMGDSYGVGAKNTLVKSSGTGAVGTWVSSNTGLPQGDITGLSLSYQSPSSNRTLFVCDNTGVATTSGVYKSIDDGNSWALVLSGNSLCTVTAVDRSNGNNVYVGGATGFWRSTTGGGSGSFANTSSLSSISKIATDNSNPSRVYAAVFGTGMGLYRSNDNGASWTQILVDNSMRGVAVHPTNPLILFATSSEVYNAGGSPFNSTGVSRSTDRGATWTQVNEGLAWPFARSVNIDPATPSIVFIGAPGNAYQKRVFAQ